MKKTLNKTLTKTQLQSIINQIQSGISLKKLCDSYNVTIIDFFNQLDSEKLYNRTFK